MTKWCRECEDTPRLIRPQQESWQPTEKSTSHKKPMGELPDPLEYCMNSQMQITYTEIKKLSILYLNKYIDETGTRGTEENNQTTEQLVWIYRLLLLPEPLLSQILFQFGDKQAKANFRRLCILTHPDKNVHPLSNKAFQKLLNVFNKQSQA